MSRFLEALRSGRVLLMDGAMGTQLQQAGLKPGECGELWNLTHPDKVRAVHRAYVNAGAEVLLTNTFQANPAALAQHQSAEQLGIIWQTAIDLVRAAGGPDRWVLADVGPFLTDDYDDYKRLATAIAAAGPDGILVETCSDSGVARRLLKAYHTVSGRSVPPFLVSLAFLRNRDASVSSIHGESPEALAGRTIGCALGVNCGRDIAMPQIVEVVETYHRATYLRMFVRPNAGTPKRVKGRWVYPHSPRYMASWLPELLEAGVSMVGGCCGTTPEHIAAFRPVIDEWNRKRGQ